MIVKPNIAQKSGLGVYAKLVVAFLCCLLTVSIYQHLRLYFEGLVDHIASQSLWLHFANQTGFTAVMALILLMPYHFLENKEPGRGKKCIYFLLGIVLSVEYLLTTFYVHTHELFSLGFDFEPNAPQFDKINFLLTVLGLVVLMYLYRVLSRRFNWASRVLKGMFPFVILLFIMVFGMLFTTKKPINQNKFQFLVTDFALEVFDFNQYEGGLEYPFLRTSVPDTTFKSHFKLSSQNPNFVVLVVQGLGGDFIGDSAKFKEFTPFLNQLSKKSLFWQNHLSNSLDTKGSITALTTSIPSLNTREKDGEQLNRNSLFGLLKEAGYKTAYYYGGNNSLLEMDKFLFQDRVDLVVDKSKFDEKYQLYPSDANGTIIGYPDHELFRKWEETYIPSSKPKFELFLNLSSVSGGIPNTEKYVSKVENLVKKGHFQDNSEWVIERQKSFFAGMLYVDQSIKNFLEKHQKTKEFENTIYVITGTQNPAFLNADQDLGDYHTPLLVFGEPVVSPKIFSNITSHADVAPSFLSLIKNNEYPSNSEFTAWLGYGLCKEETNKKIPLFRNKNRIKEFVEGTKFYRSGKVYEIGKGLFLKRHDDKDSKDRLQQSLKTFKAAHEHVVQKNKIIPDSLTVFRKEKSSYTSEELIWISSVFNGKNFDKAYEKARSLAHNGNTERALLLSQYILDHVPNHVDAMILQGRIFAWNNKYNKAIEILKTAMANNPKYHDSYSAALDVCYWAKDKKMATEIYEKMKENNVISIKLDKKVQRCLDDPKVLNTVAAIKFELNEY